MNVVCDDIDSQQTVITLGHSLYLLYIHIYGHSVWKHFGEVVIWAPHPLLSCVVFQLLVTLLVEGRATCSE